MARASHRDLRAARAEIAPHAPSQGRESVARARAVESQERDERAACRAHEHSADRALRIRVLAEEVADGCAVPVTDSRVVGANVVLHCQRGVVLDPHAGSDRTDEEVDLLTRAPWFRRAEPHALVESAHLLDD